MQHADAAAVTNRTGTVLAVDYAALERDLDAVGRVVLLRVQDTASYKARFPYNRVIANNYAEYGAPGEFARELDRAIRIELERASQRGRSRPTSGPGWRGPDFLADR